MVVFAVTRHCAANRLVSRMMRERMSPVKKCENISSGSRLAEICGPTGMVQGSTEMFEGVVVHPVYIVQAHR